MIRAKRYSETPTLTATPGATLHSGTRRHLTLTSSLTRDSRLSEDWDQKGPDKTQGQEVPVKTVGTTAEYRTVEDPTELAPFLGRSISHHPI